PPPSYPPAREAPPAGRSRPPDSERYCATPTSDGDPTVEKPVAAYQSRHDRERPHRTLHCPNSRTDLTAARADVGRDGQRRRPVSRTETGRPCSDHSRNGSSCTSVFDNSRNRSRRAGCSVTSGARSARPVPHRSRAGVHVDPLSTTPGPGLTSATIVRRSRLSELGSHSLRLVLPSACGSSQQFHGVLRHQYSRQDAERPQVQPPVSQHRNDLGELADTASRRDSPTRRRVRAIRDGPCSTQERGITIEMKISGLHFVHQEQHSQSHMPLA